MLVSTWYRERDRSGEVAKYHKFIVTRLSVESVALLSRGPHSCACARFPQLKRHHLLLERRLGLELGVGFYLIRQLVLEVAFARSGRSPAIRRQPRLDVSICVTLPLIDERTELLPRPGALVCQL